MHAIIESQWMQGWHKRPGKALYCAVDAIGRPADRPAAPPAVGLAGRRSPAHKRVTPCRHMAGGRHAARREGGPRAHCPDFALQLGDAGGLESLRLRHENKAETDHRMRVEVVNAD